MMDDGIKLHAALKQRLLKRRSELSEGLFALARESKDPSVAAFAKAYDENHLALMALEEIARSDDGKD